MTKILVVGHEPGIAFALESDLQTEGYQVSIIGDGDGAVRRARAEAFDLILLDVMLRNKDGFEVCRELRHGGLNTPIILLTAKEAEKVLGLMWGRTITSPNRSALANFEREFERCSVVPRQRAARRSTASLLVSWMWPDSNCAGKAVASIPRQRN